MPVVTKDERFLIELYRFAAAHGDPEGVVNPVQIAQKLGYKEHLTKEILKGLRQANLIRIYGPEEILLTERGREVARSLLR
jgi:Mn-dependent DtxR family transcriptional regulator